VIYVDVCLARVSSFFFAVLCVALSNMEGEVSDHILLLTGLFRTSTEAPDYDSASAHMSLLVMTSLS
jgi:hypothetical protein